MPERKRVTRETRPTGGVQTTVISGEDRDQHESRLIAAATGNIIGHQAVWITAKLHDDGTLDVRVHGHALYGERNLTVDLPASGDLGPLTAALNALLDGQRVALARYSVREAARAFIVAVDLGEDVF